MPIQEGFSTSGNTDAEALVKIAGRTFWTAPMQIPGIGTGAAYASLDAMGTIFALTGLPPSGIIQSARWYDLDDEGIAKEIWCFNGTIAGTADNAAFAPTDAELLSLECVITIANFKDASTSQMGVEDGLGISYVCPTGTFWCQVKTLGADNIAAANIPMISIRVLPD